MSDEYSMCLFVFLYVQKSYKIPLEIYSLLEPMIFSLYSSSEISTHLTFIYNLNLSYSEYSLKEATICHEAFYEAYNELKLSLNAWSS